MPAIEIGKKLEHSKKFISGKAMSNIKDYAKATVILHSICHAYITNGNHFCVLC
jgi:hypothetical protein